MVALSRRIRGENSSVSHSDFLGSKGDRDGRALGGK
jgi:hypothetical protein